MIRPKLIGPLTLGILTTVLTAMPASAAADEALLAIEPITRAKDEGLNEFRYSWGPETEDPAAARGFFEGVRKEAYAHPENTELIRFYIQVGTTIGAQNEIRSEIEGYISDNPKDPRGPYYLGLLDPANSSHFDRALELDPKFAYGKVALASVALSQTPPDAERARTLGLDAAAADPSNALAFLILSQVYRVNGDADSRVAALERAAIADPWDATIQQTLVQTVQELGQIAQQSGTVEAWATSTCETLGRVAAAGDKSPGLMVGVARIQSGMGNPDASIQALEAAASYGFSDYKGISLDRNLAALTSRPEFSSIQATMKKNREERRPEIKAEIKKGEIQKALPANIEFPLMGGGSVKLADLKGKVVVLDFWATWCGPCRKAIPVLQDFYVNKPEDVEVYCVNVFERDGGRQVEPFWAENEYKMPVALGSRENARDFGVQSIPHLFVIGPDGQIGYEHKGFTPYLDEELAMMAENLLGN